MEIPVPFLRNPVGSGDIVKAAAETVGIRQSGDCGCRKRQETMNHALTFTPRSSSWPEYPGVPEGWTLIASCGRSVLYTNGNKFMAFDVVDGKYRRAHGTCSSEDRAREELARRCR